VYYSAFLYPTPTPGSNYMSISRFALRASSPLLLGILAAFAPAASAADLVLAPVFGDHAVLQRGKPVPVWGSASPSDSITVTFHGASAKTTAGANGRWKLTIGPFDASAEPADLVVAGQNTITLHDIVVGDVWLCSGQSNMEFTVDDGGGAYRVDRFNTEVAAAHFPMIRQLKVERTVAMAPAESVKTSGWVAASPNTVNSFTAVGYFFARDIHQALGVPIGIIDSPWGGTPIESWMSDGARNSTSIAAVLGERWKREMSEWPPERVAQYPAMMAAWEKGEEDAKRTHQKNALDWPQPQRRTTPPPFQAGSSTP